jgi:hypothetical protein
VPLLPRRAVGAQYVGTCGDSNTSTTCPYLPAESGVNQAVTDAGVESKIQDEEFTFIFK